MNLKTTITLFAAIFSFSSHTARADSFGCDYGSLVELINSGAKGLQATQVYDRTSSSLDDVTLARLHEVAKEQSNIWADTILEGDYFADGNTELDSVVVYTRGSEVLAYRITYSERAWDTSSCSFDGEELETLVGCQQGRIRETSFVSGGLTSYTRDLNALAEFEN